MVTPRRFLPLTLALALPLAGVLLAGPTAMAQGATQPEKTQPEKPQTELQAARVNIACGRGTSPGIWLSPGQLRLAELIERHSRAPWPDAIGAADLMTAWDRAMVVARQLER